jgi:hypothetical protein
MHSSLAPSDTLSPFFAIAEPQAWEYRFAHSGGVHEWSAHWPQDQFIDRNIMDESIQKSCWGVTAKAMVGFASILLLAWLIGGAETAAVVATAG